MRTRLRSKVTLLFLAFAVAIFAVSGTAMAITTDGSGTTSLSPTIQSDKADYAPGELVTLTGGGWKAGESVNIKVNDTYGASWSRNVDVTADSNGNITDSFNLPNAFVSDYDVTATGTQSGTVTTTFTDSQPNNVGGVSVASPTSVTVTQGTAATYGNVSVDMVGNINTCTVTLVTSTQSGDTGLPAGASASFGNSPVNATNVDFTSSLSVSTTGVNPGTYTFHVNAQKGANCQGSSADVISTQQLTLKVNSAVTATSVSDITATNSTFGGTTNLSAKVSPLNAPGSVEFFVNGSTTAASGTVNYDPSTGVATLSNYSHGLDASNTAYSVKAVFTPSNSSYSSSNATNASALTVDKASSTTDVTCTAGPFVYTGNPITPCSVSVTGAGGLNLSPTPTYSNNVGAGTATASYTYTGDANHNGSSDSQNFNITFNFTGFSSPVDNNNVLNTAKAGQAIPLKWRLTDASGNPVTNLLITDVKVSVANYNCGLSTTADLLEEYAAGSSGLQNLGNGYYQFNWKTPTNYANSCKTMTLDLGEGTLTTPHTALFKFTK